MKNESRIITFRASKYVCAAINRIMDERGIDQTSTIKMALYMLDIYMKRPIVQNKSLIVIMEELERHASLPFSRFSLINCKSG